MVVDGGEGETVGFVCVYESIQSPTLTSQKGATLGWGTYC